MVTPNEIRCKRNKTKKIWYANLPEERKEELRRKQRESYYRRKQKKQTEFSRNIDAETNQQNVNKKQKLNDFQDKGKEQVTHFTIFEVGSTSNNYSSVELYQNEKYYSKKTLKKQKPVSIYTIKYQEVSTKNRIWYANLPEERKEELRRKQRESYYRRKQKKQREVSINIDIETNQQNVNKKQRLNDFQDKGKEQVTHFTTFEVGSTSNNYSSVELYQNEKCYSKKTSKKQKTVSINTIKYQEVPTKPYLLPEPTLCEHCGAKKFYKEPKTFCCSDGSISLKTNEPPDELYNLFFSNSTETSLFLKYVRTYNNSFAFTSFGVRYDKELCKRNKGIYTFKVQGQVYHYINDLLPIDSFPTYLQLYFYDTEHELENRMHVAPKSDVSIVRQIINILKVNPYENFFRRLQNIPALTDHQIIIRTHFDIDQRTFNLPTASQVAAIWVEGDDEQYKERNILVYNQSGHSCKVQPYYGCYDPLQYPLLFPYGEIGWHQGIPKLDKGLKKQKHDNQHIININEYVSAFELLQKEETVSKTKNNHDTVSCRGYYCYKLQIRLQNKSILLHSGRLLQQYVVDMYIKIETTRLDFFRNKQDQIRAELYQGILDSIAIGESKGFRIGKRIILPSSFIGGPRDMRKRYIDSMTLVQRYGKPDLFITMTCNPNWPEILQELRFNDEVQNRPDLVARVFKAKLEELKTDLFKKKIFGEVAAYTYVIEFQNRGLPHVHFLIILKRKHKLTSPESYDKIVCAEIPNKETNPHLYASVVKQMMHGPCGKLNPKNVCMSAQGKCKNKFPKSFCSETTLGKNTYPIYRRRDDGKQAKVRHSTLDNRWIIPYNPYLLAKFDCHINVEVCTTIKAVKYLYKYIYKGHDRVAFNITPSNSSIDIDEIQQYRAGRWISPPEAMWRIFKFPLNEIYPSVQSLQLHLEGKQLVTFHKFANLNNIVDNEANKETMLTQYFYMNKMNKNPNNLLYKQFPEHFVWNQKSKSWHPRQKRNVIGRVVTASPTEGERYYLRILLNHIGTATCFDDLLFVNDLKAHSFREAAYLRGLLESENSVDLCLQEAALYQMPYSLRQLFAIILVYCDPKNPKELWEKYESAMSEDFVHNKAFSKEQIRCKVAQIINSALESMGKNIADYKFIDFDINSFDEYEYCKEIQEQMNIVVSDEDQLAILNLNRDQKYAFDIITNRIFSNKPGAFFIDGPGGTGKTYLYRAILAAVRSKSFIALPTATSGVAASNLPFARTAHSMFKLPLNTDENTNCNISKQSGLGKLLRAAKVIIWDEATMAKKKTIEALNILLQDMNDSKLPFGGKVVVFGGDFRQVLPVVPKSTKEEIINTSLATSKLWKELQKISLKENMRAKFDPSFSEYLLRVGNGEERNILDDWIKLPSPMCIPYLDDTNSLNALINNVFPNLEKTLYSSEEIINRTILTPKNEDVEYINEMIINRFPGESYKYHSFDKTVDTNEQTQHEDFLNSLTPNGLPPHILNLKINCPIMLLRNLDPSQGLCNGTRLICRRFERNVIDAEILVGPYSGKRVFLPRLPLKPSEHEKFSIPFTRTQFPIRLCFAMTINKAQGQTLEYAGIYLPQPVFTHGQLYVALSRAKTAKCVKILAKPSEKQPRSYCTRNVVYKEIFLLSKSS